MGVCWRKSLAKYFGIRSSLANFGQLIGRLQSKRYLCSEIYTFLHDIVQSYKNAYNYVYTYVLLTFVTLQ